VNHFSPDCFINKGQYKLVLLRSCS